MGFAPVASVAILLVAGLAALAGYQGHADAAADQVRHALRDADLRAAGQRHTAISITSFDHDDALDRLTIEAENTGSTVVPTDGMDVLVDGVHHPIGSTTIAGSAYAYWPPLTSAQVVVPDVADPPARVVVVAHNGIQSYGGA